MAGEIHRITQVTLDKLKAEYHQLTTVGRTEIARVIESARALGDLSENGDYHAAKDAQGKMESRIRQIDHVIRHHEIVERDENVRDRPARLDRRRSSTRATPTTTPRSSSSARSRSSPRAWLVASPTSPLGAALLGHVVGDVVEYDAPSGALRVTIVGLR